jgi:hemoglobin
MTPISAADNAHAQAKQTMPEKSLYERLGGVFAIAAVVDHFSERCREEPHRRSDVQLGMFLRDH